MRVDGELWVSTAEYGARLLRRRVVRHHALNLLVLYQFGPNCGDLVNEDVGPCGVFYDVLVETRIAGYHDGVPVVVDPIPIRRLDGIAVIDLECGYSHTILIINHAPHLKLVGNDLDAFRGIMLVSDAHP